MTKPCVAPHLTNAEFECPCGHCSYTLSADLYNAWIKLRTAYDKPIKVVSGYRCFTHNRAVGGSRNSRHTKGQALDLGTLLPKWHGEELYHRLSEYGFHGFGRMRTGWHLDVRPADKELFWIYDKYTHEPIYLGKEIVFKPWNDSPGALALAEK